MLVALVVTASCVFPVAGSVVPVRGEVTARFVAPACERCAGRRGITVQTAPGADVVATRTGRITFAGPVAGTAWVVQEVAPGVRVTYGRLDSIEPGLTEGDSVRAGVRVGTSTGSVHLGVRRGDRYVDPLRCWAGRARLVPAPRGTVGGVGPPR